MSNHTTCLRICAHCGKEFHANYTTEKRLYCSRQCAARVNNAKNKRDYPTRTCAKCGKEFVYNRMYQAGKFCSRECSDSTNKSSHRKLPRIQKVCPTCGKAFECAPYHETKCCSMGCAAKNKAKTVVGENHPLYKPKVEMACEVCGKVCQVKPSLVSRFRSCSRRCNAYLAQKTNPRISSIEVNLIAALQSKGYAPEGQYSIPPFWIDIAFPTVKLAVECDGNYWHGNARQQKKDRQKDGYLRRRGWHVLRLTETEIKTNIDECVAKVASFLSVQPTLLVE